MKPAEKPSPPRSEVLLPAPVMQGLSPKLAKFLAEKQQQEGEAARPAAPRPSRREAPAPDREEARPTHTPEQAAAEQQQRQQQQPHPVPAWRAAAAAKQAAAVAAHSFGSSTQVAPKPGPSASPDSDASPSTPVRPSLPSSASAKARRDPPVLAKPWQPGGQAPVAPAETLNVNTAAKPPARALGRSSSSRAAAKLHQLVLIARGEGSLPAEAPSEGCAPLAGGELSPAHSAPARASSADGMIQGSHQTPARALGRSRSAAASTSGTVVPRGDAADAMTPMSHAEPTTSAPATWMEVSLRARPPTASSAQISLCIAAWPVPVVQRSAYMRRHLWLDAVQLLCHAQALGGQVAFGTRPTPSWRCMKVCPGGQMRGNLH